LSWDISSLNLGAEVVMKGITLTLWYQSSGSLHAYRKCAMLVMSLDALHA
jgi:hypothetical protein